VYTLDNEFYPQIFTWAENSCEDKTLQLINQSMIPMWLNFY